jgi:uncharacterized membrane protein
MIEVRVTQTIDRPAGEVFAYLADMANNPRWQRGMRRCQWTSEPPLRLGSTYDQEASFLGRTITSSFEVTELEPGRRIRIQTTGGSMPIDVTRHVEPDGDGCVVGAVVRGDPSGLFLLAAPIMKLLVRASVGRDYRRLKALLEAERDARWQSTS